MQDLFIYLLICHLRIVILGVKIVASKARSCLLTDTRFTSCYYFRSEFRSNKLFLFFFFAHTVFYQPDHWHFQLSAPANICHSVWVKGCLSDAIIQVACHHIMTPRSWSPALCNTCNGLEREHMTELLHVSCFFLMGCKMFVLIVKLCKIASAGLRISIFLTYCSVSILHLS